MLKRYLRITLCSLVVIATLLLALTYAALSNESLIKSKLLPRVSERLGVPLSVDSISIRPLREITLKGLRYDCQGNTAACPHDKALSLYIGSLRVTYEILALFSGELRITSLELREPYVAMRATQPTADSGELPAATPAASEQGNNTSSTSLRTTITNTSISDGYFIFKDTSGNSIYELETLQAQALRVNSQGDSDVDIKARVSVKSQSVSFSKQEISISASMHDAIDFKPTTLDVKAAAGLASTPSLTLTGNLSFNHEPYSLQAISLRQGTIRESLLKTLSIPTEPLREFEYDVTGKYTLSNPSELTATVHITKNTFSGPETHDLKGSKISAELKLASDRATLSNTSFELIDNGASIAKASITGELAFDPYQRASELSMRAPFVDLGALRALGGGISPEASSTTSSPTPRAQATAAPPPSSLDSLKLPLGKLLLVIDRAIIQKQEASPFRAEIHIPTTRTIQRARAEATFVQGGTASVDVSGSLDGSLSLKTAAKNVNMIPFAALASGPHGEIVEGSLTSADINLTALGRDLRKTINGNITLKIANLIVPSTLQGQVPFNILFIPFDALITVFGGAINLMLPASISSISDSIRQTLDKAGRLGLDASTIDLGFEKGKILLKNVDINTKNLPDFTMKGSVSAEDRLDLTVFISLLKLNLPLPIIGSPRAPLPDVVYLGPEIVRGLGLSVGSIASGAAGLLSGGKEPGEAVQ